MQSSIAFKSCLARIALRLPRHLLYKAFKWLKGQLQDLMVAPGSHKTSSPSISRHWESFSKRQQVHESSLVFRQEEIVMAGGGQHAASKPQLQASGAKRRRTENSAAAGNGSTRLREKASACAVAKLKAARQVLAQVQILGCASLNLVI